MADINRMNQANMNREMAFDASLEATQETDAKNDAALAANQADASQEKMQTEAFENSTLGIIIKTSKLQRPEKAKTEKAEKAQESILVRKEEADGLADGFSQRQNNRYYNLQPRRLSILAQLIGIGIKEDSEDIEILDIIRSNLVEKDNFGNDKEPDISVVDKTLEFLVEVTKQQVAKADEAEKSGLTKILSLLEITKDNYFQTHRKVIKTSENIMPEVFAMAKESEQVHGDTLQYYRNAVHSPQDIQSIRRHCEKIGYMAVKNQIKAFHNLAGSDVKNPRLETPEMIRLISEIRKMQAVYGVYREGKKQFEVLSKFLISKQLIEAF